MTDTIRLQEWTKAQLDGIVDSESHTSYDSAVKSLLKDREIARTRESTGEDSLSPESMLRDPLKATERLPTPPLDGGVELLFGDAGAGKTTTVAELHRKLSAADSPVHTVFLSAHGEYGEAVKRAGGVHIAVGRDVGLNPLEIRETPVELLEREDEDVDPYASKIGDVMDFFETYFHIRGHGSVPHRGVLERAVREAYDRKGITRDPSTHGGTSPTVIDVFDVLGEMSRDADQFAHSGSNREREQLERGSCELLIALGPFREGGKFENLSRETEIDLSDSRVVYVDLQPMHGEGQTELITQLLIGFVAERAKQLDDRALLVADDFPSLIQDIPNLSFLSHSARRFSQWGLTAWTVWSSPSEIAAFDDDPALFERASRIYLHRLEHLDVPMGKHLGLDTRQLRFVQTALRGQSGTGSEVLVRDRGGGWTPYRVDPPSETTDGE